MRAVVDHDARHPGDRRPGVVVDLDRPQRGGEGIHAGDRHPLQGNEVRRTEQDDPGDVLPPRGEMGVRAGRRRGPSTRSRRAARRRRPAARCARRCGRRAGARRPGRPGPRGRPGRTGRPTAARRTRTVSDRPESGTPAAAGPPTGRPARRSGRAGRCRRTGSARRR